MKKNNLFAPFLMLFAGAVASIAMYLFRYSMKEMLPVLLAVLLVFYIAGCIIQKNVLSFMNQIREKEAEAMAAAAAEAEALAQQEELSDIEGEVSVTEAGEA